MCTEITRDWRTVLPCRLLTLWRPLLPYGYSVIKHPVPDRVKPSYVMFDIRALWRWCYFHFAPFHQCLLSWCLTPLVVTKFSCVIRCSDSISNVVIGIKSLNRLNSLHSPAVAKSSRAMCIFRLYLLEPIPICSSLVLQLLVTVNSPVNMLIWLILASSQTIFSRPY